MEGEMSRIFIGRLSPRTLERDIEHIFSAYGKVKRVDLKEGYAFVFFADQKNAAEAIAAMDNKELDGNMIVVEAAHKHSNPKNNNVGRGNAELRISCSNLDQNTSWQDLKDWARAAGKVTFANVYTRDSQKLGVIEFEVRIGLSTIKCATFLFIK
jgi:splicing factor, arginine/serine-rich 4/5/6